MLRLKLIGVLITHFFVVSDVQQSELYIFIACNFLFLIVLVNEKVCDCVCLKNFKYFLRVENVPEKNGTTMIIKKQKNFKADFDSFHGNGLLITFLCVSSCLKRNKILTLGILSLLQTPSESSLSRISQANMLGHSRL